jgi:hypothetical protein
VMKEWITVQWTPNGKYRKVKPKWLIIMYYWLTILRPSHTSFLFKTSCHQTAVLHLYTLFWNHILWRISVCNALNYNLHHTHVSTFNCPHFVCIIYYLPYTLNALLLLSLIMWVQLCFSPLMDVTNF